MSKILCDLIDNALFSFFKVTNAVLLDQLELVPSTAADVSSGSIIAS